MYCLIFLVKNLEVGFGNSDFLLQFSVFLLFKVNFFQNVLDLLLIVPLLLLNSLRLLINRSQHVLKIFQKLILLLNHPLIIICVSFSQPKSWNPLLGQLLSEPAVFNEIFLVPHLSFAGFTFHFQRRNCFLFLLDFLEKHFFLLLRILPVFPEFLFVLAELASSLGVFLSPGLSLGQLTADLLVLFLKRKDIFFQSGFPSNLPLLLGSLSPKLILKFRSPFLQASPLLLTLLKLLPNRKIFLQAQILLLDKLTNSILAIDKDLLHFRILYMIKHTFSWLSSSYYFLNFKRRSWVTSICSWETLSFLILSLRALISWVRYELNLTNSLVGE